MDDQRDRLRDPGTTGPTADDPIIIDPIPERGVPVDRLEEGAVEGTGTEYGGGTVGRDADFDRIVDGSVGQAGAGTDELPTARYGDDPRDRTRDTARDASRGGVDPSGMVDRDDDAGGPFDDGTIVP